MISIQIYNNYAQSQIEIQFDNRVFRTNVGLSKIYEIEIIDSR